jgi:hypothetical protein
MTDIYRVAEQCGVKLLDTADARPGPRRQRECFAKRTLRRIGRDNGEAHLALVLRLIVETEGNAAELGRETLMAISSLLAVDPSLEARGGALFDAFDRISLAGVRTEAKAMAVGLPISKTMRVLLAQRLQQEPAEA